MADGSESVGSSQSTSAYISNVRTDRARIKLEAQQLENRIRLLISEENKAKRRVELAKQKAREILRAREEVQKGLREREMAAKHLAKLRERRRKDIAIDRQIIKEQILKKQEHHRMEKLEKVRKFKIKKGKDCQLIQKRRLAEMKALKARTLQARMERNQRSRKLEDLQVKKLRRSEMIYAAKLNWEQHLKDVEAKRLKQLEAAERSVLKRLRNESIVQHEAQRAQAMSNAMAHQEK